MDHEVHNLNYLHNAHIHDGLFRVVQFASVLAHIGRSPALLFQSFELFLKVFFKFVHFEQSQLVNLYHSQQRVVHWLPNRFLGRLHHQPVSRDNSADTGVSQLQSDRFNWVWREDNGG